MKDKELDLPDKLIKKAKIYFNDKIKDITEERMEKLLECFADDYNDRIVSFENALLETAFHEEWKNRGELKPDMVIAFRDDNWLVDSVNQSSAKIVNMRTGEDTEIAVRSEVIIIAPRD